MSMMRLMVGGGQHGGDGLQIAHLADQDHVRVLAQHVAQGLAEAVGVLADLALVDDGLAAGVEELYGILDGDDVGAALLVDLVDQSGLGCGLAVAGGAGDEHKALGAQHQVAHDLRDAEVLVVGYLVGDDAEGGGHAVALPVAVDAEAVLAGQGDGEVQLLLALEPGDLLVVEDVVDQPLGLLGRQGGGAGEVEIAVDPHGGGRAGGDEHVAGVLLDGEGEHLRHAELSVAVAVGYISAHRVPVSGAQCQTPEHSIIRGSGQSKSWRTRRAGALCVAGGPEADGLIPVPLQQH
jgi:hypothetical protein